MTRIIAGSAKGRRLSVPAKGTRPRSDRVRESLFNTVNSELLAADEEWSSVAVLDLYAGTGALGIEAASRGLYYLLKRIAQQPMSFGEILSMLICHLSRYWLRV